MRFLVIHNEMVSGFGYYRIVLDTRTGVNYLQTPTGTTPLLIGNDTVKISKPEEIEKYKKKYEDALWN